jgi:endogenous inhibitor of DNA gyrase (YacG/DUF329 family)
VQWSAAQRWRPFCSERCRLIDLGDWLSNVNSIPDDTGHDRDPLLKDHEFSPVLHGKIDRDIED